jgi:uncharacterized protein (DUF1800 family)
MPAYYSQIAGPSPTRRDRSQPRRMILRGWLLLLPAACCIGLQTQASAQLSIIGPDQMRFGGSQQYTALAAGVPTAAVWSVNGYAGGTGSTGPISTTGMYSPAAQIFAGHSVTISAKTARSGSASLSVKILNLLPIFASGSVTQTVPGTAFSLTVLGSGFVSTSQLLVAGANVATTFLSSGELRSAINLSPGTTTVTVGILNPNAAQNSPVTRTVPVEAIPAVSFTQAARLLDQATFGPTLAAIQQVQQIGTAAYLKQQFATPTTLMPAIPNPPVAACPGGTEFCAQNSFWENALTANDQLRQRVAFALSEMFVVSTDMVNARTIPSYHNMLANDAFGNFSQLMNDVATSPAMGEYLDMLDSGAPPAGQIADENFGRELMQLFTTGLYLVNPDGTLQLSAQELPQPVFTELQVQAYARALTGWTYANPTGGVPTSFPNGVPNYDQPMQPIPISHDITAKVLLDGVTLPAGQTAEEDLAGLIASIFNHPNVGPFVCRQLIQHLVTSFPSPAYVGRVAEVFANDGSGVRGDLKAVVTAILNDPEARAADTEPTVDGGHLREPILYFTGILRALQFTNVSPQGSYFIASSYTAPLGQTPYAAGSVFNFFPPSHVIPGTAINAPEFAQENTASAIARLNLADSIVRNHLTSFNIDMSPTSFLGQIASATGNAATDSANLVNTLNILFVHDQMPAAMMSAIVANAALLTDIGQRVRVSTWLVISSNYYQIEH